MKEAANGSSLNNGPFNSPFPKRSFHINKIIWLILLFSLGLNVVHLNGGQLAVLQQSIYESSTIKEDVILRMGASSSGEPPSDDQTFDPIRFIAVAGLYHTGSTNMWYSIDANIANGVASSRNISLGAFPGGYPPCGVPLFQNFDVDMQALSGATSGITEQNKILNKEWGTMWNDWKARPPPNWKKKPSREHLGSIDLPAATIQEEIPPHKSNKFYSWWKHTPPQHPMMNCFRSDTLYVIMVRHPVAWYKSTKKMPYDLKYNNLAGMWKLDRKSSPRRLPTMELQFRSLHHVWAYYMNGYLGWESASAQMNCYDIRTVKGSDNCLGGNNTIPSSRRNVILVRQEDFSIHPQKVLAEIFAFATRGKINAEKDKDEFVVFEGEKKTDHTKELEQKVRSGYFVPENLKWNGATKLPEICKRLGYSCDESPAIFLE